MNAVGNAVPEMKRVQNQLQQIDRSVQRSTRGFARQGGALRGLTRNLGQVGLQVQDVAVQASMGTDALRIFSMQGPQILSIFGPLGMIAGAIAGVGAGIIMANGGLGDLSFDFRKFATDMAPLLEPLRPVIAAIGNAFKFVGNLAIGALNGIINGVRAGAVVIGSLPDIVREAFSRMGMRFELLQISFQKMVNNIKDMFVKGMLVIVEQTSSTVNAINQQLNDALGLNLRTDVGAGALAGFYTEIQTLADEFDTLSTRAEGLETSLEQPNQAFQDMRDTLANMEKIDIRSYFSRAAGAVDGEGGSLSTALTEAQQRAQDLANTMQQNFESGFMSIIDGTKSLKDAFRDMAKSVIAELYRVLVVKRLVGSFDVATGAGSGIVGFFGRMFGGMRAQGGAVSGNKAYMVGEKGPEMIVPGTSGRVVPNNQLGGGGQPIVINQTINVSTGVQQTVRAEIKQLMPQIAESAKSAVVDAKRRGGSYGRAFA
jgi:hypothetical protein